MRRALTLSILVLSFWNEPANAQQNEVLFGNLHSHAVAIGGLFSLGAESWQAQEKDYDERVIGVYWGLGPAQLVHAPELASAPRSPAIHLLRDVSQPESFPDTIRVVIEISAGSKEKREIDAQSGKLILDRIIEYEEGYPANYGSVPGTLSGDMDPLDVVVLGPKVQPGQIMDVRVVDLLRTVDSGESDDKLIAIPDASDAEHLFTSEMKARLERWLTSYKGQGRVISGGFVGTEAARARLEVEAARWKALQRYCLPEGSVASP